MERQFAALLEQCRRGGLEVRADSRQVAPGDIFVAVAGHSEDGSRFIPAAVEAGAGVVVCRPGSAEDSLLRMPVALLCTTPTHEKLSGFWPKPGGIRTNCP